MPKDRLVSLRELKSAAEPDIPVDGDEVDNVEAVEAQRKRSSKRRVSFFRAGSIVTFGEATDAELDLQKFLDKMAKVSSDIDKISSNVEELTTLQSKALDAAIPKASDDARMSDLANENRKLGNRIRTTLKKEQAAANGNHMKETQVRSHSKMFLDVWQEYNNSQLEFRDKRKKQMARKMKVTGTELSEEEIENMLEQGRSKEAFFTKGILEETHIAKKQLTELENRHKEFLKLEQCLVEVNSLFLELCEMVAQQGDMVDSIEANVNNAKEHVEVVRENLAQAEVYKNKSRKKLKLVIAVVVGIVIIVIIALFA